MKPHPQEPQTWKPYRKGMCEGCWAGCCTMPVEVTAADLVRLDLITKEEGDWDLELVAGRLFDQRLVQYYNRRDQRFVLAQVAGRDCIYLDEKRRCSVYEKRPTTCRNFPRVSSRPNHCPHSPFKAP